jgi:hypothetical protein
MGVERLLWFALIFAIVIHLIACLWIYLAKWNFDYWDNWMIKGDYMDLTMP